MKIAIFPGETLEIEVGNADGVFTITYGEEHLTIEADLPDTSGRMGVIYDENFGSVYEMAQHIAAGAAPKSAFVEGWMNDQYAAGAAAPVEGPER